jgi:capsular polysaccharide biosynthesis protein
MTARPSYRRARLVIAPHGAGLVNILFAPSVAGLVPSQ